MTSYKYVELPFYESNDPEEYLEWEGQTEKVIKFQKLRKAQEVMRATKDFENYAYSWWQQLYIWKMTHYILNRFKDGDEKRICVILL